jgi:hypothetical protein
VRDDASLAAMLFQTERVADVLAEREFRDMCLNDKAGEEALARLIHDLRAPGLTRDLIGKLAQEPDHCSYLVTVTEPYWPLACCSLPARPKA